MIVNTINICEKLKNEFSDGVRCSFIFLVFPKEKFLWVVMKKINSQKVKEDREHRR